MALEDAENRVVESPVVVETGAVLDWVFDGVEVDRPGSGAGGSHVSLGVDGEEVVVGGRSALHLPDGSLVVVVVYEEGVGRDRPQSEVNTGCAFPLVDEQNSSLYADGVVVDAGDGGRSIVNLVAGAVPAPVSKQSVVVGAAPLVIAVVGPHIPVVADSAARYVVVVLPCYLTIGATAAGLDVPLVAGQTVRTGRSVASQTIHVA